MKKLLLPIILLMVSILAINAQNTTSADGNTDKNSFSVQFLKHALGVDYERKIYKNFGMALSAGISGAEIEAKYHLKPQINSPSFGFSTGFTWYSIEDLTEGTVTSKTSRINMFFFEYRTPKRFVFTAGLGWFDYEGEARIRARGGIGYYFPW
jgi:hypothetical protein